MNISQQTVEMSATVVAPVETELSLVERISQIEESLKDLKRAARQELKSRRRRRSKRNADGTAAPKGETPEQLKAWHTEVRAVWDEMRATDAKTPYKRAVAEASARRKGGAAAAPVAAPAPAPVAEKKAKKAKADVAAPAPATNVVVETAAPKKRLSKKTA
jgi:cellulose biosynthesis protein BcsQ